MSKKNSGLMRRAVLDLAPKCTIEQTGLTIHDSCTQDEWIEMGVKLNKIEGCVQWWIGDWLNFGLTKEYDKVIEETGYSYQTLARLSSLCNKFEITRRRVNLTFEHHKEVQSFEDHEQEELLKYAEHHDLNRNDFRGYIKRWKRQKFIKEDARAPKDVKIYNEDFRDVKLEEGSVDLILTDPPYPKEYINLWAELAEYASKVLKPGGFLITYSGQLYLNEIYPLLNLHLDYYWTGCLQHSGGNQLVHPRNVLCEWKPILMFCKPPMSKQDEPFSDIFKGGTREKDLHEWQQSEVEAERLLEIFSMPNDTVLDPFAGAGTFLCAAKNLNRNVIGIEIEEDNCKVIRKRLKDLHNERKSNEVSLV